MQPEQIENAFKDAKDERNALRENISQIRENLGDVRSQLAVHVAEFKGSARELVLMVENLRMMVSHTAEIRIDKAESSIKNIEILIRDHMHDCEQADADTKIELRNQKDRWLRIWLAITGAWIAAVAPWALMKLF